MQPVDYLSGMTYSEAMTFIHNLPGLSREEFKALIEAAESKPLIRMTNAEQKETVELRIRYFVEFLIQRKDGATRKEIADALKYNGSNMHYSINEAIERGLIYVVRGGKQHVYKATAKARRSTRKGRGEWEENRKPART